MEFGRPFQSLRGQIGSHLDTADQRVHWFKNCLNELGTCKDLQTIAFPERIGCGMAAGDWRIYLDLINSFAYTFNKQVIIVSYN